MGGRIGLFVEWADYIETEGCTLEEKRLEYRELLGEMAIYEEDLQGAELKHYTDLTTIAWWEHDETEDAEREHVGSFYICSIGKILLLTSASDGVRDLRGGSGDEWLGQPHPPCTKSDPTWGAGGWRWGGEVGGENGRPPPRRVDGALWRHQSQGGRDADGRTTLMVERSGSRVSSRVSAYPA